jgi:hypothetical protein
MRFLFGGLSLCCSLLVCATESFALELVSGSTRSISDGFACALNGDAAYHDGAYRVVFAARTAHCGTPGNVFINSHSIASSGEMSTGMGLAGPMGSAFVRIARNEGAHPQLVAVALEVTAATYKIYVASARGGSSPIAFGPAAVLTPVPREVSAASLDCFADACTFTVVERQSLNVVIRRTSIVLTAAQPNVMPMLTPRPATMADLRTAALQLASGGWEFVAPVGARTFDRFDPALRPSSQGTAAPVYGVVAVRTSATEAREFAALGAPAVAAETRVTTMGAFSPGSGSLLFDVPTLLADADGFVPNSVHLLGGVTSETSPRARLSLFIESTVRAPTLPLFLSAAAGQRITNVRVAAGRDREEGRALVLYDLETTAAPLGRVGMAALVQCNASIECDDRNGSTMDVCQSEAGGVKRCVHNAISSGDAGVSLDANVANDSGSDAERPVEDAGVDDLADVAVAPTADVFIDDVSLDVATTPDARVAAAPRITGGACDCRVGAVGPGARGVGAWAAGAALAATVGARRRRRRQL